MGTLIDSSVLIAAERGRLDLQAALASRADDPVGIAAITASEVLQGTYRLGGVRLAQAAGWMGLPCSTGRATQPGRAAGAAGVEPPRRRAAAIVLTQP